MTVNKPFYNFEKIEVRWQKKFKKIIAHNGGDWRSKSLALLLMVSTTLDGFYFANCVL